MRPRFNAATTAESYGFDQRPRCAASAARAPWTRAPARWRAVKWRLTCEPVQRAARKRAYFAAKTALAGRCS